LASRWHAVAASSGLKSQGDSRTSMRTSRRGRRRRVPLAQLAVVDPTAALGAERGEGHAYAGNAAATRRPARSSGRRGRPSSTRGSRQERHREHAGRSMYRTSERGRRLAATSHRRQKRSTPSRRSFDGRGHPYSREGCSRRGTAHLAPKLLLLVLAWRGVGSLS